MLRSVAVLVLDKLAVFEFGVLCEVFGTDRTEDGVPLLEFRVCGLRAGEPVSTTGGVQVVPEHGLEALRGADLVAVPATGLRDHALRPSENRRRNDSARWLVGRAQALLQSGAQT